MDEVPKVLKDIMSIEIADLLEEIRDGLSPNNYNDTIEVDLSEAHTDLQFEMPREIKINSLTVMPIPSAMSLKINSTAGKVIDMEERETIMITKQEIERFYVSNDAGEGRARIHIFGRVD